jgi:hypothetical protein
MPGATGAKNAAAENNRQLIKLTILFILITGCFTNTVFAVICFFLIGHKFLIFVGKSKLLKVSLFSVVFKDFIPKANIPVGFAGDYAP